MNNTWHRMTHWPEATTDPQERAVRRKRVKRGWLIATVVGLMLVPSGMSTQAAPDGFATFFVVICVLLLGLYGRYVHLVAVDDPDKANAINAGVTVAGFTFAALKNHHTHTAFQAQQKAEEQRLAQAHADHQARLLLDALRRHEQQ